MGKARSSSSDTIDMMEDRRRTVGHKTKSRDQNINNCGCTLLKMLTILGDYTGYSRIYSKIRDSNRDVKFSTRRQKTTRNQILSKAFYVQDQRTQCSAFGI